MATETRIAATPGGTPETRPAPLIPRRRCLAFIRIWSGSRTANRRGVRTALMRLNAREAAHMIELRTRPQGHPSYQRVCQRMHNLIRDTAGHAGIAKLMKYANHDNVDLEQLASETKSAAHRQGAHTETATSV